MLYTIVPWEEIWRDLDQEGAPLAELVVGGVLMQVEPLGNFQAKVVRIISSNPQDYLQPHHQPGFIIRWT